MALFLIRFRLPPDLDQVPVLLGQNLVLRQARATLGLVFIRFRLPLDLDQVHVLLGQNLVLKQARAMLGFVFDIFMHVRAPMHVSGISVAFPCTFPCMFLRTSCVHMHFSCIFNALPALIHAC